jgi:hypothetical protein
MFSLISLIGLSRRLLSCNFLILLSLNLYFISFAGTHPQILYGGVDLVTTLHAAITQPLPIVTHFRIIEFFHIRTSFQIVIGAPS